MSETLSLIPEDELAGAPTRSEATDIATPSPSRFSLKRAYAQTFTATVAIRLLGVASGILAARLLGPTGRGELAVIIFLPFFLVRLGELEIPRALAYEVSKLGKATPQIVSSGLFLGAGLGIFQMALCAAVARFVLPAEKLHLLGATRWFTVYLPVFFIFTFLTGIDQGRGRFARFSLLQAVPGFVYLIGIVLLYLSGFCSPRLFAAAVLSGVVVAASMRLWIEWPSIQSALPDGKTMASLLARGFSFYLPALAALALARTDMLLLVRFAPVKEIGLYVAAQALALGQIGSIDPFVQVGFSAIAGESVRSKALEILARQFRFAQVAVIGVALFTGILAGPIIHLAFGGQFSAAITTAYLLIGAAVFSGLGQLLDQGLRAADHPRIGILSNSLGLLLLAAIGVPACLRLGIVGLGLALLLAHLSNIAVLISFCVIRLKTSLRLFWGFDAPTLGKVLRTGYTILARFTQGHVQSVPPRASN